jgi:hypothetical protein
MTSTNSGNEGSDQRRKVKPWQRSAVESAIGSALLPPDVPWYQSELNVPANLLPGYRIGLDLGRVAGHGTLCYDLHPDNMSFNGERMIIFDPGEIKEVRVAADAFLPWLSDMRAVWGQAFEGLLAGFLMGIRCSTATSHPLLYGELVVAVGGDLRGVTPAWPLRPELARLLEQVNVTIEEEVVLANLHVLTEAPLDDSEKSVINDVARLLETDFSSSTGALTKIVPNLKRLRELAAFTSDPNTSQEQWLLSFILTKVGHRASECGAILEAAQLLQAAQLILQRVVDPSRYLEALIAFCIHAEPKAFVRPAQRRKREEVFTTLAYINSFGVTCRELFRHSLTSIDSNGINGALWSVAWDALYRIRAAQAAFAEWAGDDKEAYETAAPGLLIITRTQISIISEIFNGVLAANEHSVTIPWLVAMQKAIPNVGSEAQWCADLLELQKESISFVAQLIEHYSKLRASVDLNYLGISALSFIDTRQ